jgi:processive 1,2-diacylglycerol beta-glucosyltransferase
VNTELSSSNNAVAVLTASFGDGHNAAARGIAAALDAENRPNTGALDLLKTLRPETMRILGAGYRGIITHCPWVWRALYAGADWIPLGGDTPDGLPSVTRGVADYLNQTQPRVIVSTYPLYGHIVERLFGAGPLPFGLLTVVTDSTSINRSWINGADTHYAVADRDSAQFFIDQGIASGRVHVTGFPVHPAFGGARPRRPESALPSPFRILYAPSTKTPVMVTTLNALRTSIEQSSTEIELTVVLGRHETRLRPHAENTTPQGTEIIGWTDRMPELLGSHHLVIGKAGGASVQESLAAACPMLINYVVPGQEEGNAEQLCAAGAGAMMPAPDALADYLSDLFANSGERWLQMRTASHSHGEAGATAAAGVARLAEALAAEADRA